MIVSRFKEDFVERLRPLTWLLAKSGVHPDLLTTLGLLGNVLAAVLFAWGRFRWAGGMMLIGGLCDVLDGEVARLTDPIWEREYVGPERMREVAMQAAG